MDFYERMDQSIYHAGELKGEKKSELYDIIRHEAIKGGMLARTLMADIESDESMPVTVRLGLHAVVRGISCRMTNIRSAFTELARQATPSSVVAASEMSNGEYRPQPGDEALIVLSDEKDRTSEGSDTVLVDVLWSDDMFVLFRRKGYWPETNKWKNLDFKPIKPKE